jgi:hypothetical protein
MKVTYENHYNCSVTFCNENDGLYDAPTTFEDINAALAYCEEEIDVRQQAISAVIWDTLTGEVYATCGWDEDDTPEEDYPAWDDDYWDDGCPIDDVDESNYDPYAGCDMYEVEPFGYDY